MQFLNRISALMLGFSVPFLVQAQEIVGAENIDRCFFCEAVAGWFWMILAVVLFVVIIGGVAAFSAYFFRGDRTKPHNPIN